MRSVAKQKTVMIKSICMTCGRTWNPEALINSLSEAVLLLDTKSTIMFINKTGEEFFGRGHQEIIGKKVADISPGAKEISRLAKKVIKEMRSLSAREVELKVAGFSKADVDLAPFIVGDSCRGTLISIRENLSLAEREDSSFDSLVYLIGTIAHEIKNPLGGIKGAAQLLKGRLLEGKGARQEPGKTGTATVEYLDLIIRETDRLNTVLQNYLTMSRKPALHQINIHEVLEKALAIMDLSLKNSAISLQRFYDPSLPKVIGDSGKLLQVFLNIIKNAVEAMPRGGSLSVMTRPSREHVVQKGQMKRWAVISIRDTGKGIQQSEFQKIFLPFYTKKRRGTGLGLALSKKIIKDHQGVIRVESPENGKGTVFHVSIPFAH
jgi:two-component system nitrogen regulation sensor histidine kinase GlnL